MAPGKVQLLPVLKMKVDELFLCWLSEAETQRLLEEELRRLQAQGEEEQGEEQEHHRDPRSAPRSFPHPTDDDDDDDDPGPATSCSYSCSYSSTSSARPSWVGVDAPRPPETPGGVSRRRGRGDVYSSPSSSSPRPRPTVDAPRPPDSTVSPAGVTRLEPPTLSRRAARSQGDRAVQTLPPAPPPPPPPPPAPASSLLLPSFYFPRGRPARGEDVDAALTSVEAAFARLPRERARPADMAGVAKACGCPVYWKHPLFSAAGGERAGSVSVHGFVAMWRKILRHCHDDASRFVQLLTAPGRCHLEPGDFVGFLQDVVDSHPGLSFLKEATEFHSRYITTVIQRIFYTVNRSWSGRITCAELRRSSFLQSVALLEEEPDINRLTDFFSYEHFYVIYCKFWELDTDHDLLIDAHDLARHHDHAISTRMIDRIFSGAVTRGRRVQTEGKMTYADFVWFLLSEEDKKTPTSIEYWFRCMDLDGDGALSMFELEFFYEEQGRRLEALGLEPPPFPDCLCQMLDLVQPSTEGRITLRDLKRCKLADVFFDTFFNVEKYLEHEQREQASVLRESEAAGPALSDWEKFAAEEYDLLVAEEDGLEAELSPAALCAVDLFEFAEEAEQEEEEEEEAERGAERGAERRPR